VQHKIAADVFGRDLTAPFSFFIDHIYANFAHLVHDNLDWWKRNGFWEESAAAIEKRMAERFGGLAFNLVSHFIDCNCEETSRPGGGPTEGGANAARWDQDIQRAFYNGWKSIHGLKHQSVENAYGFCEDLFGPESLRRNDLNLLALSNQCKWKI
jgi:hypothetical protein